MTEDDTFNILSGSFEAAHTELFSQPQTTKSVLVILAKYGWTQSRYLIEYDKRVENGDPYLMNFNTRTGGFSII